jgi:hypothetical protein
MKMSEAIKRETSKDLEFSGKRWRLKKFDALTGSNIFRKFIASKSNEPQQFLASLSDEDFKSIQVACLQSCFELKNVDGMEVAIPVMLPDGARFGVEGVSEDQGLVFMLTTMQVAYNISGFFDESALKDYKKVTEEFLGVNAPT